ncbi:MAG: cytidylate kinase family protein, partial [Clostridia bacterium]
MEKMIITIGRQYGSGGREIGEKLAELLGYSYYDTLLIEKTAQE